MILLYINDIVTHEHKKVSAEHPTKQDYEVLTLYCDYIEMYI